jgi:hypothetical protein
MSTDEDSFVGKMEREGWIVLVEVVVVGCTTYVMRIHTYRYL